jgi:hypothetical protein
MPELYKGTIPIIDVTKERGIALVNPAGVGSGLKPRDFTEYPRTMFAPPDSIEQIPKSEWDAYYDEQEEKESSLEHLFLRGGKPAFVNLDQDGDGDCWAYSTGHAEMFQYLRDGVPPDQIPRLNPHFIATYLHRFGGGWCGASMEVARQVGCCVEGDGPDEWPLWSHDTRLLTPERIAAAGNHKVTEEIYDLTRDEWDQTMNRGQIATMGLTNTPAPTDYNEMSHSMCQIRWARTEPGSWWPLIINSWKGWGYHGLGILRGMDADGAVACLAATPI